VGKISVVVGVGVLLVVLTIVMSRDFFGDTSRVEKAVAWHCRHCL
jgi:hypothetical protein